MVCSDGVGLAVTPRYSISLYSVWLTVAAATTEMTPSSLAPVETPIIINGGFGHVLINSVHSTHN